MVAHVAPNRREQRRLRGLERAQRQRRQRAQSRQLEGSELRIGYRISLRVGEHHTHRLTLVDGQHGERTRTAGQCTEFVVR
jgi:hypothetical protein